MVKRSAIASVFLGGYGRVNLQKIGKAKKQKYKKGKAALGKVKAYRKEEAAFIKRKKKVNKVLSDPKNLLGTYKSKPLKLNKI